MYNKKLNHPKQPRDTGFSLLDFSAHSSDETPERGTLHCPYPRIIVRSIVARHDRILLCTRADEPRRGRWNMPGGFLENGEALHSAAIREAAEEAGMAIFPLKLAFIHEFPQLNEVVITYLAEALEERPSPGTESLDAQFFAPDTIPWHELAFPTDSDALRLHFSDILAPRDSPPIIECFWGPDGRILAR
jgi:ADP-ribose pyrophosphatase YjhB (NUDIX family)